MSRRKIRVKNFKRFFLNILGFFMIIVVTSSIISHKRNLTKENVSTATSSIAGNKLDNKKHVEKNNSNNENKSNSTVDNTKLKENEVDNKVYFQDSLFLGDSITEAMCFFNILDEKNIMGIIGLTITKATSLVDKIQQKNPKRLFVLLGNNDIDNDIDVNMNNYSKLIERLKESLPDTKIYIQGVLPVTEKASKKNKGLSDDNINNFNNHLKEACRKEDVQFINLEPMLKDVDKGIYEPDGIHFKQPFYKIWLDYLKNILN